MGLLVNAPDPFPAPSPPLLMSSRLHRLLRALEPWAIPGLLRVIASFQVICFVLLIAKPGFSEVLALTPAAWESGQVWRFFTFCFIPNTLSPIWIIFAVLILFLMGDHLEAAWGKVRLNLFYFSTVACLWIATFIAGPFLGQFVGSQASTLLYSSIFLAFATVSPNFTFMLFFILPVKVKWLACLDGALLAYEFFAIPFLRLPIALALLPYAWFALPLAWRYLRHRGRVTSRRATYQAHSLPTHHAFHQCHRCQRSDQTDPTLEFRVAADGEEYCSEHLPTPS